MAHWKSVFTDAIYEVRYEDLVNNLEGEARGLLDCCKLPFDECCLNFHENRRAVQTASFSQVRQPIHKKSVGRWKLYENMLQRLFTSLGL